MLPVPARRVLEIVVVAAFVGFATWAVERQWDQVQRALAELSVPAVALAGLATLAGLWCSFLCWRQLLIALGAGHVPLLGAMRIFFVGQVGKYLPGKVWPILTQARLGQRYDVPARVSAAAGLVLLVLLLGSGLLVALCALPALGPGAFGAYWWALLALPPAIVALWPPVLNRVLGLGMRVLRREPVPRPLTTGGVARAAGWALLMWLLYGVQLWALLRDLGAGGSFAGATGAYAGAWAVGFLLLVAPAGAGPRELALVLLLRSSVAAAPALVAALTARLLMTSGDLVWAAAALLSDRHRHRVDRTGLADDQLPQRPARAGSPTPPSRETGG